MGKIDKDIQNPEPDLTFPEFSDVFPEVQSTQNEIQEAIKRRLKGIKIESIYKTRLWSESDIFLLWGEKLSENTYIAQIKIDFPRSNSPVPLRVEFSVENDVIRIHHTDLGVTSSKMQFDLDARQLQNIISEITGTKYWKYMLQSPIEREKSINTDFPFKIHVNGNNYTIDSIHSEKERAVIKVWSYTIKFSPNLARMNLSIYKWGKKIYLSESLFKEFIYLAHYLSRHREEYNLSRFKAFKGLAQK